MMDYKKPLTKNQLERFAFMLKHKRLERGLTITKPNLYKVEDVADFFGVPLNIMIGEE